MRPVRFLACTLLASMFSTLTLAQPQITARSTAAEEMALEVGETRLVQLSDKIVRISVANPDVADVSVVTPKQVLVTAKSVGFTHIILWGENDNALVTAVSCRRNLNDLRAQIKELFPQENIKVGSTGELVVLSGKVNDLRVPSRLAEVAKMHAKNLANLVEVSGDQQVQLEVRFAEVAREGLRKMGFNFLYRDAARGNVAGLASADTQTGNYFGSVQGSPIIPGTGPGMMPPFVPFPSGADAFSVLFSTGLSSFPFSGILSVLKEQGVAKVLAEPTLVALSGHEAKFHAGGEVPILVAAQLGSVSVIFKKFGVLLKFVPTVLGERTLNLEVSSEVSEPDPTLGVTLGGYSVPGFKTRNSDTTVRLKDGQSFAIAGLLSDKVRSVAKKVPLLGEIPVLGALFRSKAFQREETELLVVVKAHLVKPMVPEDEPRLPGEDTYTDLDDFQMFLMGCTETSKGRSQREKKQSAAQLGRPLGPIGFIRY